MADTLSRLAIRGRIIVSLDIHASSPRQHLLATLPETRIGKLPFRIRSTLKLENLKRRAVAARSCREPSEASCKEIGGRKNSTREKDEKFRKIPRTLDSYLSSAELMAPGWQTDLEYPEMDHACLAEDDDDDDAVQPGIPARRPGRQDLQGGRSSSRSSPACPECSQSLASIQDIILELKGVPSRSSTNTSTSTRTSTSTNRHQSPAANSGGVSSVGRGQRDGGHLKRRPSRKAALASVERQMRAISAGQSECCCNQKLPEQLWDEFLEQMMKAGRSKAVVQILELGAQPSLETGRHTGGQDSRIPGIQRKTYERLVFAACRRTKPEDAGTLWRLWTLRSHIRPKLDGDQRAEPATQKLPRAACCALIRALGRHGEVHLADVIFTAFREENAWLTPLTAHPQEALTGRSRGDDGTGDFREALGAGSRAGHPTNGTPRGQVNAAGPRAMASRSGVPDEQEGRGADPRAMASRSGVPDEQEGRGSDPRAMASRSEIPEEQEGRGADPRAMAFNSIMEAFCRAGDSTRVLNLFHEMVGQRGIAPNKFTYSVVLQALCLRDDIQGANRALQQMKSRNVTPDRHVYAILMNWHAEKGHVREVEGLMRDMESSGLSPDAANLCCLMKAYRKQGQAGKCLSVLQVAEKQGLAVDSALLCTAISALGRQGKAQEAAQLLENAPEDVVAAAVPVWTAVMGAHLEQGDFPAALFVLTEMEAQGLRPNARTLNALAAAFAKRFGSRAALDLLERVASSSGCAQVEGYPNLATRLIKADALMRQGRHGNAAGVLGTMRREGVPLSVPFIRGVHAAHYKHNASA